MDAQPSINDFALGLKLLPEASPGINYESNFFQNPIADLRWLVSKYQEYYPLQVYNPGQTTCFEIECPAYQTRTFYGKGFFLLRVIKI